MKLTEFEAECRQLLGDLAGPDTKASVTAGLAVEVFVLRTDSIGIKRTVGAWTRTETWTVWAGPNRTVLVTGSGMTLLDAHLAFQDNLQEYYAAHLRKIEPLLVTSSKMLKNALRARSHDALMKGLAAEKAKLEE